MSTDEISIETPLIYSHPLSTLLSNEVYLKLECAQPSGSFKLRGISASCIQKLKEGSKKFVSSSGGNAGLALAYTASKLKVPCKLFVPTSVNPRMLGKIRALGAEVEVGGKIWYEANKKALEEAKEPGIGYIHPYDDPILWDAYASLVTSVKEQLKGKKPSCFVVSVGGGGLLCGVLRGLDVTGWKDIPVVAVETEGANCFNLSVKSGKLVNSPPTSIVKTLGASSPAPILMEWIHKYNIISHVITDKDAVDGSVRFADDHGMLVEFSCGASLSPVYSKILPSLLSENNYDTSGPVVIVVCGGSDVTPKMLEDYVRDFNIKL